MKCIILSPKKKNREAIEEVIQQNKFLEVIKSCGSISEAKGTLLKHKTDIVFIEIEKPGMDGFGLLDELPLGRPFKVFLSTQRELAKDAFDYDASDFILLPLTPLNLLKALGKITKPTKSIFASTVNQNFIFIKANRAITKVELKDILYIEALADYVNIQTHSKRYTVHITMKSILGQLPKNDFIRVHKSFIVRLDRIAAIEARSVTVEKKSIPLSRPFKMKLLEKIGFSH